MVANRSLFLNYTDILIAGNMYKLLTIKNPDPAGNYLTVIPVAKEPAGTKFLIVPFSTASPNTDFPPITDPKSNSWRSILINGIVDAGAWEVRLALRNPTKYEVVVKMHIRLCRSPSSDGSNATLIDEHSSGNITMGAYSELSIRILTEYKPSQTFSEEYLFIEFVLEIVTPSNSSKTYLEFRANSGPSAGVPEASWERIQTPVFSTTWQSEEGALDHSGLWSDPLYATEAYPSDDLRAWEDKEETHDYYTYEHQETVPTGADILQVLVEPEHCEPDGAYLWLQVSGDGGVSWGIINFLPSVTYCDLKHLIDVTDQWSWDRDAVVDPNFRCRVGRRSVGCLHPDSEVPLFNFGKLGLPIKKKALEVAVGDKLVGWQNGLFTPAKVTKVKILKGNFKFVRIVCYYNAHFWSPAIRELFGLTERDFGEKDIVVTANHPLWECIENKYIPAGELQVGQILAGLFTDRIENGIPHLVLAPCPIKKIETFTEKRCVHIETDKKHMFAHFRLQEFIKW